MLADTIPEPTRPSGFEVLVQLLPAFAIELAIVLVVAWFVARIGGPPIAEAAPSAPGSVRRSLLLTLVAAGGATLLGILIGREVAREISVGGLGGIAAIGLIVFVALVVIGLVLVAVIATAFRRGHATWAIGRVLIAAGLLAAGTAIGRETARGAYPQPVILTAAGTTQVSLESAGVPFVARTAGRAECRSVQDSRDVQEVTTLDIGELGPGTLQAVISIGPGGGPGDASMILAIDPADLAAGALQPTWEIGPFPTMRATTGNTTGTMKFDLSRNLDAAPSPGGTASALWPKTLSGEISWTCEPW
jgi:hypothetical protein